MSRYHDVFRKGHAVFIVIHVSSKEQAIFGARVAFDSGSDGIFLINHGVSSEELFEIYDGVRQAGAL